MWDAFQTGRLVEAVQIALGQILRGASDNRTNSTKANGRTTQLTAAELKAANGVRANSTKNIPSGLGGWPLTFEG